MSAEFKFLRKPKQYYVYGFDSNFEMDCTTNDPNATTTLYFRSSSAKWVQRTLEKGKLGKYGHVYTVIDVGTNDAGQYQCRATNALGDTIKWPDNAARVLVRDIGLVPPVKIEPIYEAVLTAGQFYNITCSSLYGTSIAWFKILSNGTSDRVSGGKTYSTSDKTTNSHKLVLMIRNAQKSETGSYKCLVTLNRNTNSKFVPLTVYGKVVVARWLLHRALVSRLTLDVFHSLTYLLL